MDRYLRGFALVVIALTASVLIVLATGAWLETYDDVVPGAAVETVGYGLPLPWRSVYFTGQGPPGPRPCPNGCTSYDWSAFLVDLFGFAFVGYFLGYGLLRRRQTYRIG